MNQDHQLREAMDADKWRILYEHNDVHFQQCGSNATWSAGAWKIGRGQVNTDPGLYLIDTEDGFLTLVHRDFRADGRDGKPALMVVLATFPAAALYDAILASVNYEDAPKCSYCLQHHTEEAGCKCARCSCGLHPQFIRTALIDGKPNVICPRCDDGERASK